MTMSTKRVAIVTGASSGIGASIAISLANSGINVVGVARRAHLIEALNEKVTGNGIILARNCDLTKENDVIDVFNYVREKFSTLDVFVNNAGAVKSNFISESSSSEIKELFDINVIATSICLREALRLMRDNKVKGHIIILNSVLGHRIPEVPVPLFSVYPATKHAITALCQTVRQEIHFHKLNIKLTSINPGLVDTDFLKVYSSAIDALPKLEAKDVAQAVIYALNTPEHLQVEDITLQAIRQFEDN